MTDARQISLAVALVLTAGLAGGWWIWGRTADLGVHVVAILDEYCLPAVTAQSLTDKNSPWIENKIGARIDVVKSGSGARDETLACNIMEFNERWSDASKETLSRVLDAWAHENVASLNRGGLVKVDTAGGTAVHPSYTWRRSGVGQSYFAFIYTHQEGRISVVSFGKTTFTDTAENTGRITDA